MKAKCWALVFEGFIRAVDMNDEALGIINATEYGNRAEIRRAEVVVK